MKGEVTLNYKGKYTLKDSISNNKETLHFLPNTFNRGRAQ